MRLLDDIIGKEVLDYTASVMGKVKDIEIDTASNRLESIIVKEGGLNRSIISSSKKETVVPFEMINKIGDKIVLKKTLDDTELVIMELMNEL